MKALSHILFPATVLAMTVSGILGTGRPEQHTVAVGAPVSFTDTVTYPVSGYKIGRNGEDFGTYTLPDSLLDDGYVLRLNASDEPQLTALDTLIPPDSLRLTDPFRYKYYAALLDSAAHVFVRDTLIESRAERLASEDSLLLALAELDSLDRFQLDSIYYADSLVIAREAFERWYAGLDPKERKAYDKEQERLRKAAIRDSLDLVKEEAKFIRDSILEATPRILETFALADTMHYKRIISWTTDPDFQQMDVIIPDTTYNYHYEDYPFKHRDLNATWLGVAGSPVQSYNFFRRDSDEGVDFYTAQESWSFSPRTVESFNTKTPHTELAYFGTLLAGQEKESDNLHLFTTQNITPALNVSFLYKRYGGGGMLDNETVANKTTVLNTNYLGKKYQMRAGYIGHKVNAHENGGIRDNMWIRDTTVDARDIAVNLTDASSTIKKRTLYLEQQLRIPFTFIQRMRAARDSTYTFDADSLDNDITTAFIGHSTEYSTYSRKYVDNIFSYDAAGRAFYHNQFYFDPATSLDSLHVNRLDNKLFIKLQPWSADAIVSNLNIGLGDVLETSFDSTAVHRENDLYLYAGAGGNFRNNLTWGAKARYNVAGSNHGDLSLSADARLDLYPFRRARTSPLSVGAHFETSLLSPTYYQDVMHTNHFQWENSFAKTSTTRIEGMVDIPRWKLRADVGYALLANNIYYDTLGIVRQNAEAMSVLAASLRKDFDIGGFLHLDNQVLFQLSSKPDVVPVPQLAFNLRYYIQFVVARDEAKNKIMEMQIGANVLYNTPWYAPAWNPALGVFHNQNEYLYNNGPIIDAFVNIQWKRACIFIKVENVGLGWPMEHPDYFTAHHYIDTQRSVKLGIFWPFYIEPSPNRGR